MLTDALGGRAYASDRMEIGYEPVWLTSAGSADPVLREADGPLLSWHGDTFDVPPGAELLARSERFPQAYRVGSALAVQFHPEASPDVVRSWIDGVGHDRLRAFGVDPDALLAAVRRHADEAESVARRIFNALDRPDPHLSSTVGCDGCGQNRRGARCSPRVIRTHREVT